MQTFPVMLNLTDRKALVVGAGPIGLRKARALRDAGAQVLLVSGPDGCKALPDGVECLLESYRPDHLAGSAIVFACTDDATLNARIADDARRAGILVNAVDQPDDCDFFSPAVHRNGPVVLAVGTGGAAPHLAGWLMRTCAAAVPERLGDFAESVNRQRKAILADQAPGPERTRQLKDLASADAFARFCQADETHPDDESPPTPGSMP